jgi:hypothetical protein
MQWITLIGTIEEHWDVSSPFSFFFFFIFSSLSSLLPNKPLDDIYTAGFIGPVIIIVGSS